MKSAGAVMPSCGTAHTKYALGEPMKLAHISFLPVAGLIGAVAKSRIGAAAPSIFTWNVIFGLRVTASTVTLLITYSILIAPAGSRLALEAIQPAFVLAPLV